MLPSLPPLAPSLSARFKVKLLHVLLHLSAILHRHVRIPPNNNWKKISIRILLCELTVCTAFPVTLRYVIWYISVNAFPWATSKADTRKYMQTRTRNGETFYIPKQYDKTMTIRCDISFRSYLLTCLSSRRKKRDMISLNHRIVLF